MTITGIFAAWATAELTEPSSRPGNPRGRMRQLIDNAEEYLEAAVRAGTIKPSRDPKARAKFIGTTGGGGFLLCLNMHDNPTDMAAVLRDYGREMLLPTLEIYTHGLMTDASMYDAVLAREESG